MDFFTAVGVLVVYAAVCAAVAYGFTALSDYCERRADDRVW